MKRFIVLTLLVILFGVSSNIQAQFKEATAAWGLSAGGAHGDNQASDKWVMQYRGFFAFDIMPGFIGQVGLGFADLNAPDVYSALTLITDLRLMVSPFSLGNLNPYLYAGIGASKDLNLNGSSFLPIVPFGIGMQTRISNGVLLDISGGYDLSLSDQLDHHARSSNDLNSLTGGKEDGFYGFSVGVAFTIGGVDEAAELQKKQLAEAEARRVKQQADADAEAQRVKEATDKEARNVKGLSDAEARRVKQQADADAEAARVKAATDAEAQRVKDANNAEAQRIKDSTNAAALLLAQQKSNDTVIVLVKGKTVVLRGVNFEFNKATLTKYSENILWKAYNAMLANPDVSVVITGHTDNVGSQKYNQALSLKRAQAVKNWLVEKGIASKRMRTVGRGQNEPVASNDTEDGRTENRRIEFYVEK
jgi:outer membrane protein OmpA-like peptidoglycan-associated protein